MSPTTYKIEPPYYPIIYVRGYAMSPSEREETFHDTYYGFSATSVEKRDAPPPDYFQADVFEGQLIRLMKMRDYGYADEVNRGLEISHANPSRSIWISRFYDQDFMNEKLRSIEEHAEDLRKLVCEKIPNRLKDNGVALGDDDREYKAILIAHSMGGLVCRTLIQNLLPNQTAAKAEDRDPKRWIHRLVTMGTPHGGIELGMIPDFLENFITTRVNPFDANIFKEERMREYLKLTEKKGGRYIFDVHSLGPQDTPTSFPVKRCLCIIGSDYHSYGVVKKATGGFSDGLVKQDRAYVVGGEAPADGEYGEDQKCFWANVHRAHSGYKGIVNSFESYENLQRFLFGNMRAEITLDNLTIKAAPEEGDNYFYDFEFLFSIRRSSAYLHRCQQDPCENALRYKREELPKTLRLHAGFLNSVLKDEGEPFSQFSFKFRVIEHRVKESFLWDHEYPERPIYNETLELRVGDVDPARPGTEIQYRWLSDGDQWTHVDPVNEKYTFPLRSAGSISADVVIKVGPWPDKKLTGDEDFVSAAVQDKRRKQNEQLPAGAEAGS
jgi:hypothetical protein